MTGKRAAVGSIPPFLASFLFKRCLLWTPSLTATASLTINETLKRLSSLPILMQESFCGGDSVALGRPIVPPWERFGRGRLYTYRYTVTTTMTPALRWAAMRAILMFHNCEGQSHKDNVHRPQLLKRKESRSGFEPRSLCLPA